MPQQREHDPYVTDPDFKQEWFGNVAVSGNSGRDRRLDIWIQGAVLAAILSLVGIVWTMRDNLTEITTFVKIKAEQYDRDISRIDATLARHDERLTVVERGQGSGNRQSDPGPQRQ